MIYCENIMNVTLFFFYSPQISDHTSSFFFFPIFGNAIATISLSIFFFFSLWALHAHFSHPDNRIGQRNFGIHIVEIQHFLSPPFSSSLSYFWLNFGNGNIEIQSLSSESQISFNSSYKANLVQILQY